MMMALPAAGGAVRPAVFSVRKLEKEQSMVTNHAVSGYQFNNANAISWCKSTFSEGIEFKDLGSNFHSPAGCVSLIVYTD